MAETLPENPITKILEDARDEVGRMTASDITPDELGRIVYQIARKAYRKGHDDGWADALSK
jgi:hypothetical protein